MNQHRRLHSCGASFVPKAMIRQTTQFPIHERNQQMKRFRVSPLPFEKQLGYGLL
jgi:hypothetical protein